MTGQEYYTNFTLASGVEDHLKAVEKIAMHYYKLKNGE